MTPSANPDPLAGLRGYHLPDAVSWWPPAPGWWLLAGLLVLAAGVAAWLFVRRRRRRAALRAALAELDALTGELAALDPADFARRLSRLLRRYALTRYPRREVAGLTGEAWLRFLDTHGDAQVFTRGRGRLLQEAPYRPSADAAALRDLAAVSRDWILRNTGAAA
jgi:LPXTG-motif cell wall-anchored protein